MVNQCCFNAGLISLTMAQQQPNIGSLSLAGVAEHLHNVHFAASPAAVIRVTHPPPFAGQAMCPDNTIQNISQQQIIG